MRSVNKRISKLEKLTEPLQQTSYLKKQPKSDFIPSRASAKISRFKTRRKFIEYIQRLEKQKLDLGIVRGRPPKKQQSIFTNQWIKEKTIIYKENIIKAMDNSGAFTQQQIDYISTQLNNLTEEEFVYYYSKLRPDETIGYIYHDPSLAEKKFNNISSNIQQAFGKKLTTTEYQNYQQVKDVLRRNT